jgi:glycosyltransferase involved in cell wall biosynthesis
MKFLFSHLHPFQKDWYGGGNQIVRGLGRQLARLGHQVHISSTGRDEMGLRQVDAPVTYHLTGSFDRRSLGVHCAWQTIRLARREAPDLVCCLTAEAAFVVPACVRLGIPVIVYQCAPELPRFRDLGASTPRMIRYKLGLFLQYLGARAAPRIFTISDFSTQEIIRNWGIPPQRLTTIGTGLDAVFTDRERPPSHRPLDRERGLRFISVGRLTLAQKPLDLVAAALKDLPLRWQHWTIVGSGPDEGTLRDVIRSLGLEDRTTFAGTLPSERIAALMEEHDVALLPSRFESFFITAYEAAASGKIIVTNPVADVGTYFRHSPSVIMAHDVSPEAYGEAIGRAAGLHGMQGAQSGETALRVKTDFSWDAIASRFLRALG